MLLKKLLNPLFYLRAKIYSVLGDIKIFPWPCFIQYCPEEYKTTGVDFKEVFSQIKPCDVLLCRYSRYLDAGVIPGFWNHASFYTQDAGQTPLDGTVSHFMSEGFVKESLFEFMRTDYICLLRPKFDFNKTLVSKRMREAEGKQYDFGFNFNNPNRLSCSEYICYLFEGCDHRIPKTEKWYGSGSTPSDIQKGNFETIYTNKP